MIELTEAYRRLDDEISELNAKLKAVTAERKEVASSIQDEMIQQGLASFSNPHGSFSLIKKPIASVQSWEQFYEYIREHNAFYLLERRASNKACLEELTLTPDLPLGIDIIELPSLSVRKS